VDTGPSRGSGLGNILGASSAGVSGGAGRSDAGGSGEGSGSGTGTHTGATTRGELPGSTITATDGRTVQRGHTDTGDLFNRPGDSAEGATSGQDGTGSEGAGRTIFGSGHRTGRTGSEGTTGSGTRPEGSKPADRKSLADFLKPRKS